MSSQHLLSVDRSSYLPLYIQIRDQLRRLIIESQLESIQLTDDWLANEFKVSRMTVRQALDLLVQEGLIRREKGRGTLVAVPPLQGQLSSIERFFEEWYLQGANVRVELLTREMRHADAHTASVLGVQIGEAVGFFRRLRSIDAGPVCIDERYMLPTMFAMLSDADLIKEPTWLVIQQKLGVSIERADMRILATAASEKEAMLLTVEEGFPLLERYLDCYSVDGRGVLSGPSVFRSDRFVYQVTVMP